MGRTVFTGAATANPTSIDVNPAALGLGDTTEFYLAALAVVNRYGIDRDGIDINTGAVTDGPAATTDYTASPGGTLAYVYHTGNDGRITLGFEIMRTAPAERFLEREEYRYHTLGGYQRTIAPLAIAASLRLTRRFYIGVSIASQSNFLTLRYARDTALESGRDSERGINSDCNGSVCGVENPAAAERYNIEVDSGLFSTSIISANLGIAVMLAKDVWLGVGWHVPPGLAVQNELKGEMQITQSGRDERDALTGAATVYISQPTSVDAELRARIPQNLDLHVGGRWEDLSRFQSYDVRGYGSTLPQNNIPEWQIRPRGFHDTFALWAGVEQIGRTSPLALGARLGFETSALVDRRTSPLTIAPTSATLDLGLQYRLAPNLILQLTYGLQYFPTVDVTNSAYDPIARLTCIDSGYDYTKPGCVSTRYGYAIPTADGEYSRIEQAMRLAVRIERD